MAKRSGKFWRKLSLVLQPTRFERELDAEMRFHFEMLVEEYLRGGMPLKEARRAARQRFGDSDVFKQRSRQMWGSRWIRFPHLNLGGSFRQAGRRLLQKPGFSLVAVLTLALGIGANTAIFSVSYAVLLRPLPYPEADRIVTVAEVLRVGGEYSPGYTFLDWKDHSRSLEAVAAYDMTALNMTGGGEPERVSGVTATRQIFDVLGVRPARGRAFSAQEDRPGGPRVAVVTDGFWNRTFGPQTRLDGQRLTLDERTHQVIGVMEASFRFPHSPETEILLPYALDEEAERTSGTVSLLRVIGRMGPTATLEETRAELQLIRRQSDKSIKGAAPALVAVRPLQEEISAPVRPALLVLLGVVGFLLLIACLNVANLLLARWTGRRKEVWIRTALGASRGRLLQQYLAEGTLLSALAGVLGLLFAWAGVRLIVGLTPASAGGEVFQLVEVGLHPAVLGFTACVALLIGLLFGGIPVLASSRAGLNRPPDVGRSTTADRRGNRSRGVLMVAEVASALVLLTGSLLLLRSFQELMQTSPGFEPRQLLTMAVSLPRQRYPEQSKRQQFFDELIRQVEGLPAVQAAGLADSLPLTSIRRMRIGIRAQGQPLPPSGESPVTRIVSVTPGYSRTMGFQLVEGEHLSEKRNPDALPQILLNRRMAQRLWPQQSALGKRLVRGKQGQPWAMVTGVVEDVRHNGLDGEVQEEAFGLFQDFSRAYFAYIVVQAQGDPLALAGPIRQAVQSLDPDQPVFSIQTMEQRLMASIAPQRFHLLLLSLFAGLALLLVAAGLYSVLSYAVEQRSREIGLRVALGASRRTIFRLVVGKGMLLTAIGLSLGLAASFGLTRFMSGLLYGVSASDPMTFAAAPFFLAVIALAACWIPALRATRVDPIEVLRCE